MEVHFSTGKDDWSTPSLSQLLAEIERRGYGWEFRYYREHKNYEIDLYGTCHCGSEHGYSHDKIFFHVSSITPKEAAGQALLWILEQEGKNA